MEHTSTLAHKGNSAKTGRRQLQPLVRLPPIYGLLGSIQPDQGRDAMPYTDACADGKSSIASCPRTSLEREGDENPGHEERGTGTEHQERRISQHRSSDGVRVMLGGSLTDRG